MDDEQQAQQSQYASAAGQTETFGQPAEPSSEPASAAAGVAGRSAHPIRFPIRLRGLKWRWVLAGIALVVAAGAAFAAWSYLNSPSRIVGQAFGKLSGVKTLHFDARATSQIKGFGDLGGSESDVREDDRGSDDYDSSVSVVPVAKAAEDSSNQGSPVDVTVGVKGVTDVSNPDQPKTAATITLAGKVAKVTLLSAGLDVKSIGTSGYFRLSDFTDASSLAGADLLNPIKGQWIKVDEQDVSEATGGKSNDQKSSEQFKLPDRDKVKQLAAAANQSKLITFKSLKGDSIDGQPAYHYGYAINKQHLQAFIPKASQIISGQPLSEAEIKEITDVFKSIDFNEGEIWIGKQDRLPHKVTLGIQSHSEDFSDIILSLTMNDFDKPVKIEPPAKAKTFAELEKQLLGAGPFGGTLGNGSNGGNDSDGDGHSDSEEIRQGFNPYGPGRTSSPQY